jgi:hypothetical protein
MGKSIQVFHGVITNNHKIGYVGAGNIQGAVHSYDALSLPHIQIAPGLYCDAVQSHYAISASQENSVWRELSYVPQRFGRFNA